jgi:hypothetical protein
MDDSEMENNKLSTKILVENLIDMATVNQKRYIQAEQLLMECYYTPWWNIYKKHKLNNLIIDHLKKFENL